MNRRPAPSLVANPVLVGAATLLVVLVGVFLAYNANSGLPFVPTYDVNAVVPDAAELVPGNDVRIGGKRVGVVSEITAQRAQDGTVSSRLKLKLEKAAEPLRSNTLVTVRPRSPLGLKYVELKPSRTGQELASGGTLNRAGRIVELDEVLNTFDKQVRQANRDLIREFSNGLAGRGADLNGALAAFDPLVTHLEPVMRTLASRSANLRGFIDGLESAASAVQPVARNLAGLLDQGATTFEALDRAHDGLDRTLAEAPSTVRVATSALRTARPVLADSAALARGLRAGTRVLPQASRTLAAAVRAGTPVLRRGVTLGPELERTLRSFGHLVDEPGTAITFSQLKPTLKSAGPTLDYIAPFQTKCNYLGLWTRNAPSAISEGDAYGNFFRFITIVEPAEMLQSATPSARLHNTTYGNLGHGECETGNETWMPGQQIGAGAPGTQPEHTEPTASVTGGSRR